MIAMDNHTQRILQHIIAERGDEWLEGVLDTLLEWHLAIRLDEAELDELAGDDPAARAVLLEQISDEGLEVVEHNYLVLRKYALGLLRAGHAYQRGAARLLKACQTGAPA